ncbi:MAG: thioredoxin family protein [Dehalococcoidia bacterium]
MADALELSPAEFDAAIADPAQPVLVDFWAPWCGSCRLLAPTVARLAETLDGVRVVTLDVDADPALAERLGVRSVPTLVLYRGGAEIIRSNGVKSMTTLVDLLQPHLA